MNEQEHYAFCERMIAQAAALLKDLQNGHTPNEGDIRRRRRTGAIALQGLYDALRHMFITPIDREDMWRLCALSERVLFAAEETALRCSADTHDRGTLAEMCRQLHKAVAAFPSFRREDEVLEHIAALQPFLTALRCSSHAEEQALPQACAQLVDELLFVALKNE